MLDIVPCSCFSFECSAHDQGISGSNFKLLGISRKTDFLLKVISITRYFPLLNSAEFCLISDIFTCGILFNIDYEVLTRSMVMFQVSAGDLHILNNMEQTKGKFNSNIKVFRRFQCMFVIQNNRYWFAA